VASPPVGSWAEQIGPAPPFDPELATALAPLAEFLAIPLTAESLLMLRQPDRAATPPLSDDDLRPGRRFLVEERVMPGPGALPTSRC